MIWYISLGMTAYLAAGIATAAMMLSALDESDVGRDEPLGILLIIFLWPIHLIVLLPAYIAWRIKSARERKPDPMPDDSHSWRE